MKNKGFTLIELLAVILILGIISIIAIPTINNIIVEARIGSNRATSNNIIEVAERNCQIAKLHGKTSSGTYSIEGIKSLVKGKINATGIYGVDDECNVLLALTYKYNDNLCYVKTLDEESIVTYEMDDVMTCLPMRTEATTDSCFEYSEAEKEVTITGYKCGGSITTITGTSPLDYNIAEYSMGTKMDVVIPNYINGKPVTAIADYAFLPANIETVTIDYNKKTIINSLVIPKNVKTIGAYAFAFNEIKSLTLNEGLEEIKEGAFCRNQITGSLVIPNNVIVEPYVFANNDINSLDIGKNVKIGKGALYSWHDESINPSSNINLRKIINRTGEKQDWYYIINGWELGTGDQNYISGKFKVYTHAIPEYIIDIVAE